MIAKDKKPQDPNAVTLDELRTLCDNILNLSSTTIDAMQKVNFIVNIYPLFFNSLSH